MNNNKLHSIEKSGFKTPRDYFSNLEEQLQSEIKLTELAENSGFKVPEDYLNRFEDRLLQNLDTKNDNKIISLFSWKNIAAVSTIAACLAIIFNLFYVKEADLTFENLETVSIENYLQSREYSADEMATLIYSENLLDETFLDRDINEKQLEDYLLDNDYDELIIN